MNKFGTNWLSPYVSDALAFLVLGISISAILGVASLNGKVNEAALYQSGKTISAVTSL